MPATTIEVPARSGAYRIVVASGALARLREAAADAGLPGTPIVVSSPRVWQAVGERLGGRIEPILVPDGERAKTLGTVMRVYDALLDRAADRGAVIAAVGGGVLGDLVGFAAATYLRGVPLVQVPTTLMAQVDSAIGGKTGVNHQRGKNLIGAFHAPALVLVDPDALLTLSRREFRSGIYEVVKYGCIAEPSLLEVLDARLPQVLSQRGDELTTVVTTSCRIKADVVGQDERESGLRRILNFGHTVGHALEAATAYKRLRHGEAVALGMRTALALGAARGVTPTPLVERVGALLARMGPLPSVSDLSAATILDAVRRDKKVVHGRLHFVLIGERGPLIADDVTPREIRASLSTIGIRGK